MKAKSLFILILMDLMAFPLHATTVKWLTKPEYDVIRYYSKDIFKCRKNGKYQLIDLTGKKLLPSGFEADSITDFRGGYALVLDFPDEKDRNLNMRIKGFLSESDHRFVTLKEKGVFHTTFYSYFSEGMLVAANDKGKLGYFNTEGNLSIKCHYQKARPFIKGWASVVPEKKETPKYIDKNENSLTVYFNDGVLKLASNFNENGQALVVSSKNEIAVIDINDTKGKVLSLEGSNIESHVRINYDYAYKDGVEECNPPHNEMPEFSEEIFLFYSGGLWGYKIGDNELLMPQFTNADRFANGYAIVSFGNKYGIITIIDGSFSSTFDDTTINFKENEASECNYVLRIPKGFETEQLEFSFDNGEGEMRPIDVKKLPRVDKTDVSEYTYTFIPKITKTDKTCTLRTEISTDGLLLWRETRSVGVAAQDMATSSTPLFELISPYLGKQKKADLNNKMTVYSTVKNNSDTPVEVTVEFETPSLLPQNHLITETESSKTINAKGQKTFSIQFEVREKQKVRITVKAIVKKENGEIETLDKKSQWITLRPKDDIDID